MLALQPRQGIPGHVVELILGYSCTGAAMERTGLRGMWGLFFFFVRRYRIQLLKPFESVSISFFLVLRFHTVSVKC